jgi:hypothetical protein
MDAILYFADPVWLEFHRENSSRIVAFYRLPWKEWGRDSMLFLQGHGSLPRPIVAGGRITALEKIPQNEAWRRYGVQLGAATEIAWRENAAKMLSSSQTKYHGLLSVSTLEDFCFAPRPIPLQSIGLQDTSRTSWLRIGDESAVQTVVDLLATGTTSENVTFEKRTRWGGAESAWHRNTCDAIASDPASIGLDRADCVDVWLDSIRSRKGRGLWTRLRTLKHPDVVFEHRSGALTVVEVEPELTFLEGVAQLIGDYLVSVNVDRLSLDGRPLAQGVLVVDHCTAEREQQWRSFFARSAVRLLKWGVE